MARALLPAVRRARAGAAAALAVGALLAGAGAGPAHADGEGPDAAPRPAFTVADPRIGESSGLAASGRHPGVVWTHNDSGDRPRLFAVGPAGETLAVLTLAGATAQDWEALAPGPDGTLWVGDLGDNLRRRPSVAVYRLVEPATLGDATVPAQRFRLRYPDGPHDAEALLVHPRTGALYVVTKELAGAAVYAAPVPLRADTDAEPDNLLTRVADAPALVTDGAFAPDGRLLVLRDYATAWVFDATGGVPGRYLDDVGFPPQRQGESVAWTPDGTALLLGSEGQHAPVWRVGLAPVALAGQPVPHPAPASATPAPRATPAGSVAALPGAPGGAGWAVAGVALTAALLAGGVLTVVRRRPGRGR